VGFPKRVGWRLAGRVAVAMIYAVLVVGLGEWFALTKLPFGNELAAILGMALGILIVFRNTTAFARWWEARTLWGQLNNDLRNLALKARAHAALEGEEPRRFARLLTGFAHALRLHLRGVSRVQAVPGWEHEPTAFPHSPGYVAGLIHAALDDWNRQGRLVGSLWLLDQHARALMDVCGGCERIRNTPLPGSYRAMVRWGILLDILIAPWALAIGWWGLAVLAAEYGFLLGIELTAEVIEEPFGLDEDDLPLEAYCQTIEAFVTATLGSPSP
jgi:putative membrane protein